MVDQGEWKFEGIYGSNGLTWLFSFLRNVSDEPQNTVKCGVGESPPYHKVGRLELGLEIEQAAIEGEKVECRWLTRPLSPFKGDVTNRVLVELDASDPLDRYFVRAELADSEVYSPAMDESLMFPVRRAAVGIEWNETILDDGTKHITGTRLHAGGESRFPSLSAVKKACHTNIL